MHFTQTFETQGVRNRFYCSALEHGKGSLPGGWALCSASLKSDQVASDSAESFSPCVSSVLVDSSSSDSMQGSRVGPQVCPFYPEENVLSEKCVSVFRFWVRVLSGFCASPEDILLPRTGASLAPAVQPPERTRLLFVFWLSSDPCWSLGDVAAFAHLVSS